MVHRAATNADKIQGGIGGKSFITVIMCGSATGDMLPSYVIYNSERLFEEWCISGPPDAGYSNSDKRLRLFVNVLLIYGLISGWMNQMTFFNGLTKCF